MPADADITSDSNGPRESDGDLLRRYVEGSHAAFAELARRYLDLVYSAAMRQTGHDTHRAEDIAQIVFLTLARKAPRLTHHPTLAGWLYTATQHAAAKAVRAEARRRIRETHAMENMSADSAPIDWSRVQPVLDEAMRELNDTEREAVLLRFFARRPFSDIGGALQLSEDAARMRVARALEKLRSVLSRRGVDSTTAALATVLADHAVLAGPATLAAKLTGVAAVGLGAGTATWPWLTLMTTTQKTLTVAGAVVLAAILGVTFQSKQAATAGLSEASQQLAGLQDELRAADGQAATRQAELDRLRSASKAPAAAAKQPNKAEAEAMRLYFAAEWSTIVSSALPLIEKLRLTPEQVAAYAALLDRVDPNVYTPGPNAQSSYLAALQAEWETKTREIVGAEKFARLRQGQGAQKEIEKIGNYLAHWDVPLVGPQANQLFDLFLTNLPRLQAARGDQAVIQSVLDDVLTQSQTFLSPEQVTGIRRLHGLARTQEALHERLKARDAATAK